MKKRKKIIFVVLAAFVVYNIVMVSVYLIPHLRQSQEDSWYKAEVYQAALNYVDGLVNDTTEMEVLGCSYSLDQEIVKSNRNLSYEEKSYPFTQAEVSVVAGRDIYILKMDPVSRGEFEITIVQKTENNKYFTYW